MVLFEKQKCKILCNISLVIPNADAFLGALKEFIGWGDFGHQSYYHYTLKSLKAKGF